MKYEAVASELRYAIVSVVLVAGCRGGDAESRRAEPFVAQPAPAPVDAAPPRLHVPRLSMEREAFWSRFVGDPPGTPGPEMLAWCSDPSSRSEHVDLEPGVRVYRDEDECVLRALRRETVEELRAVLKRWQLHRGDTWLDENEDTWVDNKHRLTAKVRYDESGDSLIVAWHPHVSMGMIIGTNGRLLRDLDLESLVDAPLATVQENVRPPLRIRYCFNYCVVNGPSPPGGYSVEVRFEPHQRMPVEVGMYGNPTDALRSIKRSLGPPTRETFDYLEFNRGGFKYTVHWNIAKVWISLQRLPVE